MGRSKFIRRSTESYFHQVKRQQRLIEENYDCFSCRTSRKKLTCIGNIRPIDSCEEYIIKIEYDLRKTPKAYVISPVIEYNPDIHMYKVDNNLCLFYPKENPWSNKKDVYNTIIPWVSEWLIYYELYRLGWGWLGDSQPHTGRKESA